MGTLCTPTQFIFLPLKQHRGLGGINKRAFQKNYYSGAPLWGECSALILKRTHFSSFLLISHFSSFTRTIHLGGPVGFFYQYTLPIQLRKKRRLCGLEEEVHIEHLMPDICWHLQIFSFTFEGQRLNEQTRITCYPCPKALTLQTFGLKRIQTDIAIQRFLADILLRHFLVVQ